MWVVFLWFKMRFSVNDIMKKIAATVNQEATAPTTGGAEYLLWLEYLNRGVQEWSEANDWEVLRKTYYPTAITNGTVQMPLDYKKLASAPYLHQTGDEDGGTEYPDIRDEQRGMYKKTDNYIIESGDISSGYTLQFHPATFASGASLEIQYFSMPTSLSAPTQYPIVTDSQFLIDRTIAYIFEARSDPRFQQQESKARERLLQTIENANLSKFNSYGNPNPVPNFLRKFGFRVGRD